MTPANTREMRDLEQAIAKAGAQHDSPIGRGATPAEVAAAAAQIAREWSGELLRVTARGCDLIVEVLR